MLVVASSGPYQKVDSACTTPVNARERGRLVRIRSKARYSRYRNNQRCSRFAPVRTGRPPSQQIVRGELPACYRKRFRIDISDSSLRFPVSYFA